MSFRTRFWGKIGVQAKNGADANFKKLPALAPAPPVKMVPLEKAWGIPGSTMMIADELPSSVLPMSEKVTQAVLHALLRVLPNTEQKTRWDKDTATAHLNDIFDGADKVTLWQDWATDEAWARTFVQGPCAGDLHREGDAWVVDASLFGGVSHKPGVANLGVKVAVAIDENGTRPLWIQRHDGTRVTPQDGNWGGARIIASAAMQNYVGMVRHVLNLHYIAAQGMSVFVHNHLPWEHPIHRLLWPHVAGTLRVNWTASRNFVGPHTLGVQNYAFSWEGWQQLVPAGWKLFRWEEYDIPEVFKKRGTDELIQKGLYPYGEDALLIWGCIEKYVADYLDQYYADDAALAADKTLQSGLLAMDAVLPQPIRGATKAELTRVLTRFIHMVSVEHKLVSGIAYEFFTHPYFFPTTAREGRTAEEAVPYREEAEQNLMFRLAIASEAWRMLEDWTYVCLDDKGKDAMRRFHASLRAAGKEIEARNTKRKVPFPHLHPDGLETSVAV